MRKEFRIYSDPLLTKSSSKFFWDTGLHSLLGALLVSGHSMWERPLLSQKKHLWNESLKIGNFLKINLMKREKLLTLL